MKEITFEMAQSLGLIPDNMLERAMKAANGCSILSKGTDRFIESVYKSLEKETHEKYKFVKFDGEVLKVI